VRQSTKEAPNFGEPPQGEVRRSHLPQASKMKELALHTRRDRKRKRRISEPSRSFDTPLTIALNNPQFLCRSHPRFPQLLKAALHTFVAEGQTLDDPRDLTEETTAQTAFYTHRGLDEQASSIRPPSELLTPLPGCLLKNMDGPEGRHGKMRERFCERLESTYSPPGSAVRRLSMLLS
jgi:hypothetical protein